MLNLYKKKFVSIIQIFWIYPIIFEHVLTMTMFKNLSSYRKNDEVDGQGIVAQRLSGTLKKLPYNPLRKNKPVWKSFHQYFNLLLIKIAMMIKFLKFFFVRIQYTILPLHGKS